FLISHQLLGMAYSDTWRFNGMDWALWNDNNLAFGTPRQFSHDYSPGIRVFAAAATTPTKTAAYILGGQAGSPQTYSDVWRFESDKGWAYWAGTIGESAPVGTKKVPNESNQYGSRVSHTVAVDKDENIRIFGG